MGYSCTAEADTTMHKIVEQFPSKSNFWTGDDGKEYMFEVGRERPDGSITGQVFDQRGHKKGGIKIMPNGVLKSFPHLPQKIREKIIKLCQ